MKPQISLFKKSLLLVLIGFLCQIVNCGEILAADKFPEKPIKMLVGYSAGGMLDLMGRMLGASVTEYLGQPIIVVCKPGASGSLALAELATSKPDGYTLANLMIQNLSLVPHVIEVRFDPMNSFEPILSYATSPLGICVRHDAPWNSFKELIEFARKNPGELTVSTTGTWGALHLAFERFAQIKKISWKHVPYPGGASSAAALLGGHVKVNFGSGSHMPFVESGKFKLLAIYADERSPKYPNVPTLKEFGCDTPISNSNIIIVPKGVPEPIIKTLEDVFGKAAKKQGFKEFLEKAYYEPDFKDRENLKRLIEKEHRAWGETLDRLNMKVK